jgi:hypothetical protein
MMYTSSDHILCGLGEMAARGVNCVVSLLKQLQHLLVLFAAIH